ncbi:uncharacterized protein LOC129907623 [Episyrphus balteatus]|uniref:uncharacterized protein LOC129907623 n=1 Tax=Episyrphus balteatus TaxID=286459 RepID=UPI002484F68C|nr:uncharacterized protein LOC129907623 [Episyrphus balteatus]
MIANFVIHVKLLLQSIWKYGVQLDQRIPDEIFKKWLLWKEELPKLNQCRVPRCHNIYLSAATKIVLHTFVDASEEAFSAVTYLRIEVGDQVSVSFIAGKTRCAPKKLISIPRLELSAAVLGIRLCNTIIEHHDLTFADKIFWSDSKTVLNWLKSEPRHQKQFVGFRIAEILESSHVNQWRWIPSKLNPADEATRSRYPPKYNPESKWLNGPSILALPEDSWPSRPEDIESYVCQEEMKLKFILFAQTHVKRS